MNHPGQDIAKTLRAFLPLRVGGVGGADGERAGVRCSFHHLRVPGEGGRHANFQWDGRSPLNPIMVGEEKKTALILAFSPRRRNRCSRVWSI